MPKGRWPRGVTPRLRSGAAAESARLRKRSNGREELPHVRGQGQLPGVPGCDSPGAAERSYPTSEVRGGSWEELPPRPRPGAADRKSNPTCKERWLHGCRRA